MKLLIHLLIALTLCSSAYSTELSPTAKVESAAFTSTPLPPGIGQSINWLSLTDGFLRLGTVRTADISMDTVVMMFSATDSTIVGAGLTIFRNLLNSGYVRVSDTSAMLMHYARYSDTANIVANRLKISDTLTMLSNRLKISDTATMLLHYVRSLSQLLRDSSGYLVPNSGNRGLNSFADINSYGNITGNTGFFATTGSGNVVSGSNTDILGSGTFLRGGSNRDKSPLNVWGYNGDSIINATLGGIYLFKNVVLSAPLTVTGSITNTSLTGTLIKTNSGGQQVAAIAGVDYATPGSISSDEVFTRTGAIITAISPGTNLTLSGTIQAGNLSVAGTSTSNIGGTTTMNSVSINNGLNASSVTGIGGSASIAGFNSITGITLNGTIGTAAQPNITSLGTLSILTVNGVVAATTFSGSGANLTNIPNSALTNSSLTIGSTNISLGATATSIAGLTALTSQFITATKSYDLSTTGATDQAGRFLYDAANGYSMRGIAGSVNDWIIKNAAGSTIATVPTTTTNINFTGIINAAGITVTGTVQANSFSGTLITIAPAVSQAGLDMRNGSTVLQLYPNSVILSPINASFKTTISLDNLTSGIGAKVAGIKHYIAIDTAAINVFDNTSGISHFQTINTNALTTDISNNLPTVSGEIATGVKLSGTTVITTNSGGGFSTTGKITTGTLSVSGDVTIVGNVTTGTISPTAVYCGQNGSFLGDATSGGIPLRVRAASSSVTLQLIGRSNAGADESAIQFLKNDGVTSNATISTGTGILSFATNGTNAATFNASQQVFNAANSLNWNITSDKRIKENIKSVSNALSIIDSLNPVIFDYTKEFSGKRRWKDGQIKGNYGFIADEYGKVLPKYMSTNKDSINGKEVDLKGIDQSPIGAINTAAIKELHAIVLVQQIQIDTQNNIIKLLESRLSALENKLKK